MTVLQLYSHHIQAIQAHAERAYPEECCGLLLGQLNPDAKVVTDVLPTENSWNDESAAAFQSIEGSAHLESSKRMRFSIAPDAMLKAQKDARDRNLDIIGIYHSHPDHPAIPSEFDRAIAWPQYSYIIVSVQGGLASDLNSWSLDENQQFQIEELAILSP